MAQNHHRILLGSLNQSLIWPVCRLSRVLSPSLVYSERSIGLVRLVLAKSPKQMSHLSCLCFGSGALSPYVLARTRSIQDLHCRISNLTSCPIRQTWVIYLGVE